MQRRGGLGGGGHPERDGGGDEGHADADAGPGVGPLGALAVGHHGGPRGDGAEEEDPAALARLLGLRVTLEHGVGVGGALGGLGGLVLGGGGARGDGGERRHHLEHDPR